mgnify:CR=1 FL=1
MYLQIADNEFTSQAAVTPLRLMNHSGGVVFSPPRNYAADDLPTLMSIATAHYNALEEVMHTGRSSFWDDVDTATQEGPAQIWAAALRAAADELDRRLPQPGIDDFHTGVTECSRDDFNPPIVTVQTGFG